MRRSQAEFAAHTQAALVIQAHERGRVARALLRKLKAEAAEALAAKESRAATTIQAHARRRAAMRGLKRAVTSAILIQAHARGRVARKELSRLQEGKDGRATRRPRCRRACGCESRGRSIALPSGASCESRLRRAAQAPSACYGRRCTRRFASKRSRGVGRRWARCARLWARRPYWRATAGGQGRAQSDACWRGTGCMPARRL